MTLLSGAEINRGRLVLALCRSSVANHKVTWEKMVAFECKMHAPAITGVLEECILRVSVRKVSCVWLWPSVWDVEPCQWSVITPAWLCTAGRGALACVRTCRACGLLVGVLNGAGGWMHNGTYSSCYARFSGGGHFLARNRRPLWRNCGCMRPYLWL